jgi:FkbM family methyltransferase
MSMYYIYKDKALAARSEKGKGNVISVKNIILTNLQKVFFKKNRWIIKIRKGKPTGVDLPFDLSVVITESHPFVFDVGANVGQSIRMFQEVFPNSTIHAFEPSPECFAQLAANNWGARIKLHQLALGAKDEEAPFNQYELSVLNSLLPLERVADNCFADVPCTSVTTVKTRTLDAVCDELGVTRIDLLKIDTQGYDMHVLEGASRMLRFNCVSAITIELNFVPMYNGQASPQEILDLLNGYGFKLVDFYEKDRHGNALGWCTALFIKNNQGILAKAEK